MSFGSFAKPTAATSVAKRPAQHEVPRRAFAGLARSSAVLALAIYGMFGSGCSATTPDGSPDEAPDATFTDANSDPTPGTADSRDARENAEASTVDARAVDGAAMPDGATIPDAAITDGRGFLDDARDAARDATRRSMPRATFATAP